MVYNMLWCLSAPQLQQSWTWLQYACHQWALPRGWSWTLSAGQSSSTWRYWRRTIWSNRQGCAVQHLYLPKCGLKMSPWHISLRLLNRIFSRAYGFKYWRSGFKLSDSNVLWLSTDSTVQRTYIPDNRHVLFSPLSTVLEYEIRVNKSTTLTCSRDVCNLNWSSCKLQWCGYIIYCADISNMKGLECSSYMYFVNLRVTCSLIVFENVISNIWWLS